MKVHGNIEGTKNPFPEPQLPHTLLELARMALLSSPFITLSPRLHVKGRPSGSGVYGPKGSQSLAASSSHCSSVYNSREDPVDLAQ